MLPLWSFQGARGPRPPDTRSTASRGGLSKLNSAARVEVDVVLGESSHRTAGKDPGHRRARAHRSKSSGFPRKDVIQPQLPLRLPCYDFTPVTDPTFDGSLPCGLGHRLRVLPASVV